MILDEILNLWDIDSQMDPMDLSEESVKSARLHAKYYRYFSKEKLILVSMEQDKKVLMKVTVPALRPIWAIRTPIQACNRAIQSCSASQSG